MSGKRIRHVAIGSAAALAFGLGAGLAQAAESVLFIGNSFTYGAGSPAWKYRVNSITDLNNPAGAEAGAGPVGAGRVGAAAPATAVAGADAAAPGGPCASAGPGGPGGPGRPVGGGNTGPTGGVPALFKMFTQEAGLDYDVSAETVGGMGLEYHYAQKRALIDKSWDHVVMQSQSVLDATKPGDPTLLISGARDLAEMLGAKNPRVNVLLTSTWSRADQVYCPTGHWAGQPIEQMALDLRRGYDAAAVSSPYIRGVLPVGEAWNRAFAVGLADPNPFDGVSFNQISLWTNDYYHASAAGYYLEALMVFGKITGRDPASLGPQEIAARELGLSRTQATALQEVARDELAASSRP